MSLIIVSDFDPRAWSSADELRFRSLSQSWDIPLTVTGSRSPASRLTHLNLANDFNPAERDIEPLQQLRGTDG